MSLVTAAVMFAPSLAHAQGITSHYLGTPAPAFAAVDHIAERGVAVDHRKMSG